MKNGAPTEMRVAGQRLEHQRVERADEHGARRRREEQVVEDERALAADRGEDAARRQRPGAEREEGQRAADEEGEDGEDEDAARRVRGEGVHRGEDARADEEGAEEARLKARMARSTVQMRSALRFSMTIAEWRSAVAASHGMNEAFSTGSQNQKPPQPSS